MNQNQFIKQVKTVCEKYVKAEAIKLDNQNSFCESKCVSYLSVTIFFTTDQGKDTNVTFHLFKNVCKMNQEPYTLASLLELVKKEAEAKFTCNL